MGLKKGFSRSTIATPLTTVITHERETTNGEDDGAGRNTGSRSSA
jgi:hypothetical protein